MYWERMQIIRRTGVIRTIESYRFTAPDSMLLLSDIVPVSHLFLCFGEPRSSPLGHARFAVCLNVRNVFELCGLEYRLTGIMVVISVYLNRNMNVCLWQAMHRARRPHWLVFSRRSIGKSEVNDGMNRLDSAETIMVTNLKIVQSFT